MYNDSAWSEMTRFVSLLRFEERDNVILWDEYCPENDNNSYGMIREITDEYFILEFIENGNLADKGEQRKYVRIEE